MELCAILLAIEWMEGVRNRRIVICSDSFSSLLSIKNGTAKTHQQILYEIQLKISRLTLQGREIVFMRVWKEINKQWNQYWKNQGKGRHLYKLQ